MLSRAAILSDFRVGPTVVDISVPSLKPGEILVEVDAAPVGVLDVGIADGRFGSDAILPLIMGREGSGRILETKGRTVDVNGISLEPGQRIVWTHPWCGQCRACAVDRQPMLCNTVLGYGWGPSPSEKLNGTFSEYVIVDPDSNVFVVADAVDPVLAATATAAVSAVVHALAGEPRIRFSDHVVVLGAGEWGLYAAAVALTSGATGVHLLARSEVGSDVVSSWGLSSSFDVAHSTSVERREEIMDRTHGQGCDLVIDCAGPMGESPETSDSEEGFDLLRNGGTYISVSPSPRSRISPTKPARPNSHHRFVQSFGADGRDMREALSLIESHHRRLSLSEVISGSPRFSLDEVPAALAVRREGSEMSPIVLPTT